MQQYLLAENSMVEKTLNPTEKTSPNLHKALNDMRTIADAVTVRNFKTPNRKNDVLKKQAMTINNTPNLQYINSNNVQMQQFFTKENRLQLSNTSQVNQQRSNTSDKKLFMQEFYNLKHKNQKRQLAEFSLHNHPAVYIDGIFSKQGGNADGNLQNQNLHQSSGKYITSPKGNRLKKLHQSLIEQTRSSSKEPIEVKVISKYGIGDQNRQMYAHKKEDNIQSGEVRYSQFQDQGKITSVKSSGLLPQISNGPNQISLKPKLQKIQSSGPKEDSQVIYKAPRDSYRDRDFDSASRDHYSFNQSQEIQPLKTKIIASVQKIPAYHGSTTTLREQLGPNRESVTKITESQSNLVSETEITQSLISNRSKIQNAYNIASDYKLYKSIQRDAYGSNAPMDDGYNFPVENRSSKLIGRSSGRLPSEYVIKTNKLQLRHPGLKHEETRPHLTHTSVQLETFAKNDPVFQTVGPDQHQNDVKQMVKKKFKRTDGLPNRNPSSDFVNIKNQASQQSSLESKRSSDLDEILGTNIKDTQGFYKKIEKKMDEMIDPSNVQIFNLEQSKYLYQVVTKQANKEKEAKQKLQKRAQQRNSKPFQQLQAINSTSPERRSTKKVRVDNSKQTSPRSPARSTKSIRSRRPSQVSSRSLSNFSPSKQQSLTRLRQSSPTSDASRKTRKSNNSKIAGGGSPSRRQKREVVKDSSRPDYFAMKGRITVDALKEKFERDLFNNLKLAQKAGVFNVIKNMQLDAEEKMKWINRRKAAKLEESGSVESIIEPVFPGYTDRIDNAGLYLRSQQITQRKKEIERSAEELGQKSGFNLGEGSKVDLSYIFKNFQRGLLKEWSQEMMQELIQRDEMLAFMSQMVANRVKHDDGGISVQELDLINYIKYLVGETKNKDFVFRREDFSQKHELNKKSLKLPFDEYAEQEENTMKTVANDIIERVDYGTIVRHVDEPASIIKYETNPKFAYFQICQKDSDLAIALLAKVVNRQLSLMNYQLSIGHVKAFVSTFDFNKMFVNRFLFNNCGMTDAHNEILLTAMEKLETVVSIVLKHEEFGLRSVRAIKPIIERLKPNNLQILRLIDCKVTTQITRELISILSQQNSLKVLGLVNAKIGEASMQEIGHIVAKSKKLQELDISWNVLKPQSYNILIASLASNKYLLSLNLSWNRIVDSTETISEPQPNGVFSARQNPNPFKEMSQSPQNINPKTSPKGNGPAQSTIETPWHEKVVKFTDLSQSVVDNLKTLLKRNKKLQHVNLTNTGLTEYMCLQIGSTLSRAKSMVSLHMCMNPGSTARVKEYLHKRIRCMPHQEMIKFSAGELINSMGGVDTEKIIRRQLRQGQEGVGEEPIARETIKIKQNLERKRIHSLVNDFGDDAAIDSRMIFTRVLGQKQSIPGSGQWKLIASKHEECWVCDQEVYGMIFWDDQFITKKSYLSTKNPHQEHIMRSVVDKLHQITSREKEDRLAALHPTVPLIMGDFTNWQPRPFTEIVQLTEQDQPQLEVDQIIQKMQFDKVLPYKKTETGMFDQNDWANYKRYVCDFYEKYAPNSWKNIISKKLLYKKPHLVFAAHTRPDFYKQLFCIAAMFKVGKHEFIVRAPQQVFDRNYYEWVDRGDAEPEYSYFTTVSDIRVEEIHPFVKQDSHHQNVRKFNKETSVFAAWKQDTAKQNDYAFQLDMENGRLNKLIKDPEDLAKTTAYLKQNYQFIRECYLDLQYNSVYPFVNKMELSNFCDRSKLIDDRLNLANCDLLFVSSNVVIRPGISHKSGLIRCEFFEYLVRLANFKYLQTQQVPTFCQAIQIVIEQYIKQNYIPMPWQQFRDEELWTIEVNDVFEANLEGINRLHNYYFTGTQKYMSGTDAIHLFTRDIGGILTVKQAQYCLAFCKMTVKDEINEFEKYIKLQPVELLEMIGRAAKIKYLNTEAEEEPLSTRIEMILDLLFPLIKLRRRDVIRFEENESASDEDY